MVFRVGRPVETHYEFVEHIWERINESGLQFGEGSIVINKIRFWGWHNNNEIIDFKFKLID